MSSGPNGGRASDPHHFSFVLRCNRRRISAMSLQKPMTGRKSWKNIPNPAIREGSLHGQHGLGRRNLALTDAQCRRRGALRFTSFLSSVSNSSLEWEVSKCPALVSRMWEARLSISSGILGLGTERAISSSSPRVEAKDGVEEDLAHGLDRHDVLAVGE